MLTTGPQFLLRVRTDSPEVYGATAVAPYPLGPGRVLDLPTMELTVPLASRHRREAVDFALYVDERRQPAGFCRLVVIFPSTRAAAADPYFTHAGASPEDRARVIAASELGIARDLTVVVPHSDDLFRVFREAVERAFYGRMTPQQALDWRSRSGTATSRIAAPAARGAHASASPAGRGPSPPICSSSRPSRCWRRSPSTR